MKVSLRYVTARRNRDGSLRFYWIRPGQPRVRLPDDESKRIKRATELNEEADGGGTMHASAPGSVAWAVEHYRRSESFTKRSASTRRAYGRWMAILEEKHGSRPLVALNRGAVKTIIESIPGMGGRRHMAAVLLRIVEVARDHEYLQANTADKLRIPQANRRDVIWLPAHEDAFNEACDGDLHGPMMRRGLQVLLFTGQRPIDVVGMSWAHYDGDIVQVVQQKTGKRVPVVCHRDLKTILDEAKKDANGLTILTKPNGQPWTIDYFRERFGKIKRRAGLAGHRAADCRRTAVMRLYEVEATEAEIASITGHSIADVKNILNNWYFTRSAALARSGIAKLERRQDKKV